MRAREQIVAIAAAHEALTGEVVHAARLMAAQRRDAFAALLDRHRAELNVVIGDFAMWAESFGEWAKVDVGNAIYPPVPTEPPTELPALRFERELRRAREALASRRTNVLAALSGAREALRAAGLPVEHLTAYRRLVRLWAGEAVDLVTEAHRLAVADRYLRRLGRLSTNVDADGPTGAAVLRQWMQELQDADREGELTFAEVCGYGRFVEWYRAGPGFPGAPCATT
jgi:hypothetical protein